MNCCLKFDIVNEINIFKLIVVKTPLKLCTLIFIYIAHYTQLLPSELDYVIYNNDVFLMPSQKSKMAVILNVQNFKYEVFWCHELVSALGVL